MALSAKAKKELLRMEVRAMCPYLIEMTDNTDPKNPAVEYYANSDDDITFGGHTYKACYFEVVPPEKTETKIGNGKLTFSAVDQDWIRRIRSTQNRFKVKFLAVIIYLEDGKKGGIEAMNEMNFTLTDASWDDSGAITWTMMFDDKMDVMIPPDKLSALVCPGIV